MHFSLTTDGTVATIDYSNIIGLIDRTKSKLGSQSQKRYARSQRKLIFDGRVAFTPAIAAALRNRVSRLTDWD
ncbi:hypothetical protein [Chamaesiphon minutus]|uniref:hypothetical protein n=1 Tax=Chamaesiphon minutus TaxID=1173032 RepID=UPI0002E4BD04|nr:hypothetical protein [Chamaesiphon minutus]